MTLAKSIIFQFSNYFSPHIVNRTCSYDDVTIIVVVKGAIPNMPLKRSEVLRVTLVVRIRREVKFDGNATVIVNQEGNPRGTRMFV